jgi:hypothetical protein
MSDLVIPLNDNMRAKLENYASKRDQNLIDIAYNYLSKLVESDEEEEDWDWDAPYTDEEEFYSPENVAHILESLKQFEEGKFVTFTLDELKAMANEKI